jgi:hypothetical protein
MKITIEIVWYLFEKGHVVSISAFGMVQPEAGAASGATHWRGGVRLSPTLSITTLFFVGAYK